MAMPGQEGSLIVDGRMGAMVHVRASAVCSNCRLYASGHIERPNSVPLRSWPSQDRRHFLPEPHQISSCTLCRWPSGVLHHRRNEGNNTPYFLIPTILVVGGMFLLLRFDLFLVVIAASAASFSAHVYLDKQYHAERSSLARFAWFKRKQQLHFVHHLHANSNFAVIDSFWDRLLGTYRSPNTDVR